MGAFDSDEPRTRVSRPAVGGRLPAGRPPVLELTEGPGAPREILLEQDSLVLGRGSSVDVDLGSEEVSRHHCRLSRVDDEYQVEDLGSRNGLYLNGLKVHLAVLREGDELRLGDLGFRYHEGS